MACRPVQNYPKPQRQKHSSDRQVLLDKVKIDKLSVLIMLGQPVSDNVWLKCCQFKYCQLFSLVSEFARMLPMHLDEWGRGWERVGLVGSASQYRGKGSGAADTGETLDDVTWQSFLIADVEGLKGTVLQLNSQMTMANAEIVNLQKQFSAFRWDGVSGDGP